jgi:hypothetical protein
MTLFAAGVFPIADFGASGRPAIDWPAIQCELKRRSVTLALLWQEYLAEHPNGYSYTRFCELYADWRKHVSPTMRQTHLAGEKLFFDWAGDTIAVVDLASGARTSLSPPSGLRTSLTPRRAGARCCRTGSRRMSTLRRSAECRGRWCPIMCLGI